MKKIIFYTLVFLLPVMAKAQTVYQLKYMYHANGYDLPLTALYFQRADDSGFMRVRYVDPNTGDDFIYQMDLQDEYLKDKTTGKYLTNQLYVNTVNAQTWGDMDISKKMMPSFEFVLNTTSGFLEPKSVLLTDEQGKKTVDNAAHLEARFLSGKDITQELFAQYFYPDEPFFIHYFTSNAKDVTAKETKMKMYVILVADTLEEVVGKACGFNIRRVSNTFSSIAKYIGCDYIERRVMGASYNRRNVISAIKLVKPGPKDIVVFYYTGHGYRKKEDKRRYPYLDLRVKDTDNYLVETVSMDDVHKWMNDKKARLTLVFSECCNTYVGAGNPVGPPPLAKKSIPPAMDMKNIRTLFLDPVRKSVLATAADSTQKATINPDFGGFFSYCLKNAIELNGSKDALAPSWYNILEDARTQTYRMGRKADCAEKGQPEIRCYQIPCYRIQ